MRRSFSRLILLTICVVTTRLVSAATSPQRIVSLSPAMTELVCQLGATDRLVGRSTACNFPPAITSLPIVGDFTIPHAEKIIALKPDLIVTNDLFNPQVTRLFQEQGIRVFNFQITTLAEYIECTRRLGDLLQLQPQAEAEIRRIQPFCKTPSAGTKALIVIWDNPLLIAGENTFPTELLRAAGGVTPDFGNNAGYFTPSEEWMRSLQLDAIVVFPRNTLLDRLAFPIIHFPDEDLLMRPGPRWTQGVDILRRELILHAPKTDAPTRKPSHETVQKTIWSLRAWRVLAAFAVGGILALAGLLFQTLFNNPLATPYTLGISSGAATGAACAFVLSSHAWLPATVPAAAFTGAVLTLIVVLFFSRHERAGTDTLLLCGVIAGIILSAILIHIISVADSTELASVTWWTLGDLQCLPPVGIQLLLALLVIGGVVAQFHANSLNALLMGDEAASAMGIHPRTVRIVIIIVASLMTALAVSLAGIIGFVGLIIPHVVRRCVSANHRRLILPTILAGGLFLVLCDTATRFINPIRQTPVGVVTAIIGGILFLVQLQHRRY